MDVLREREVKDSLDRQLIEERKLRGKCKLYFYFFPNRLKRFKLLSLILIFYNSPKLQFGTFLILDSYDLPLAATVANIKLYLIFQ